MTASSTLLRRTSAWPQARLWIGLAVCLGLLNACTTPTKLTGEVDSGIQKEMSGAVAKGPTGAVPAMVSDALAEPAPPAVTPPAEPRLDLLVNNASAREVFLALVADTRYSMLMHPDVKGSISVTLRGVTVKEALEAIRDVYGYDFRMEGGRITVYAPTLQTRIFTLNFPHTQRNGRSEVRVSSGAQTYPNAGPTGAPTTGAPAATAPGAPGSTPSAATIQRENSRVSTNSSSDIWAELSEAVHGLVGKSEGRSVVISPQAGIMAVRAMPEELRQVDRFLKAMQLAVERQVMLEAKIVEVELYDGSQSGVNWGGYSWDSGSNSGGAYGVLGSQGVTTGSITPGAAVRGAVPFPNISTGGGLFGLALATSQFAGVLTFLETQGKVQTLSSPRVATLNNQKAVLKVGSDDYYVTSVTGGTTTYTGAVGSTGSTTMPTITLAPFFSGISLDVTPQIDDGNTIMLHIHPAVSSVTEKTKQVDLGAVGQYQLPLASSAVNETDTMVRMQDGNIAAIGGLMQMASSQAASGVPGTTGSSWGVLFGNRANSANKRELVVLIKPTIIRSAADWEAQTERARAALADLDTSRRRVIRIEGQAPGDASATPAR